MNETGVLFCTDLSAQISLLSSCHTDLSTELSAQVFPQSPQLILHSSFCSTPPPLLSFCHDTNAKHNLTVSLQEKTENDKSHNPTHKNTPLLVYRGRCGKKTKKRQRLKWRLKIYFKIYFRHIFLFLTLLPSSLFYI